MSEFYKKLPDYIEKRGDKEGLKWCGHDNSFEIFPHLNLDWEQLSKIYKKSGKPIGDLGSSFSTIPVEGELRGIDILPIDIMHEANKSRYQGIMEENFQYGVLDRVYDKQRWYTSKLPDETQKTMGTDKPLENYWEGVRAAIQKVMDKFIVADLSNIPLKDRSLSVTIASDSIPKHSSDLKTFLEKQLPEILRVTDQVAYIYPMSIYKVILWKEKYNLETGEDYWKKASNFTPKEEKEEKLFAQMNPEEEISEEETLEESHALYKDPESIKQISEVAEKLGFEFRLEKSSKTEQEEHKDKGDVFRGDPFMRHQQKEAMLGIFIRKGK